MYNGTLAKKLAGHQFRRADTVRDERADKPSHAVEEFLMATASRFFRRNISNTQVDFFANPIISCIPKFTSLSQENLRKELITAITNYRFDLDSEKDLITAFTILGEGCFRVFGFYPHKVQYMGAKTLLMGELAEMQTGEGKTLVAGLAATFMAISDASVHVVSTNDYLAKRDAEEMQHLFGFFGLEAGYVIEGMEPDERKIQYRKPICYVSGKELVFDYLKDRLAGHGFQLTRVAYLQNLLSESIASEPVIPCLHFVIVDEADSVLIDEARTPLIISRDADGLYEPDLIEWAIDQARKMEEGKDYTISSQRTVMLTDQAMLKCSSIPSSVRVVWQTPRWQSLLLKQAITAMHLFKLDQHYIIAESKIQIVDESTGRVMPDRTWENGLHQLIECKEGLDQSGSRETIAKMTFQRFFRKYYLLSGLTGTALEARHELWSTYGLRVRKIPSNKPNKRIRLPDVCCESMQDKWLCIAEEIIAATSAGRPVLVGTRSVEASEMLNKVLHSQNIEHTVLNARQDVDEAEVIRLAGHARTVTVATNMAGRGTDIKLTEEARAAGGLYVILSEFHESPRVDRQLFGRSGRQGDPGFARSIICTDDEIYVKHNGIFLTLLRSEKLKKIRGVLCLLITKRVQAFAEKQAQQMRKQTLKQDKSLHKTIGFVGKIL